MATIKTNREDVRKMLNILENTNNVADDSPLQISDDYAFEEQGILIRPRLTATQENFNVVGALFHNLKITR